METTIIACHENTGVERMETFTIRLSVPKSKLQKQLDDGSLSFPQPISFNRGLLDGIPNKFELTIKALTLSGVYIHLPAELSNRSPSRPRVTGIKLSLIEDGDESYSQGMIKLNADDYAEGRYPKGPLTGSNHFYIGSGNEKNNMWTHSVNELRFDITVVQSTKLQFKFSTHVLTSPKMEMVPTPRFMDFSRYFLSSQLSDASIKCAEETFPVHLFLLTECSPVFAKMFEHNLKEAELRCVEIKDTQSAAVRELLRYFYTQTVNDLNVVGFELYELADKYFVEDLKTFCTNFLASYVNMENVTELYCFGRRHENQTLVNTAKDFITKTVKISVRSNHDLQTFLKDVPAPFSDDIFELLWENFEAK